MNAFSLCLIVLIIEVENTVLEYINKRNDLLKQDDLKIDLSLVNLKNNQHYYKMVSLSNNNNQTITKTSLAYLNYYSRDRCIEVENSLWSRTFKKSQNEIQNSLVPNYKQKIFFLRRNVFPCLDKFVIIIYKLNTPLKKYKHLLRIYHSIQILNKNKSLSNEEKDYVYVKELVILPNTSSVVYSIDCTLFNYNFHSYCFRYVSINLKSNKIKNETQLYCIFTLDYSRIKSNHNLFALKHEKANFLNLIQLISKLKNNSTAVQKEQNKKVIFCCECIAQILNVNLTKFILQIGYKSSKQDMPYIQDYNNRLNSENNKQNKNEDKKCICLVKLVLPAWIYFQIKDEFVDRNNIIKGSRNINENENLIIRDGDSNIAARLAILSTYQYISSGFLRFEILKFKFFRIEIRIKQFIIKQTVNQTNKLITTLLKNNQEDKISKTSIMTGFTLCSFVSCLIVLAIYQHVLKVSSNGKLQNFNLETRQIKKVDYLERIEKEQNTKHDKKNHKHHFKADSKVALKKLQNCKISTKLEKNSLNNSQISLEIDYYDYFIPLFLTQKY